MTDLTNKVNRLSAVGGGASGPDLEWLRRFADRGDRGRAPCFTGREQVIAEIRARHADIAARHRAGDVQPADSGAFLITGAPGAGKTALLRHLRAHLKPEEKTGEGDLAVAVDIEDFGDPGNLARSVRRAASGRNYGQLAASVRSFSVSVLGLGASVELDRDEDTNLSVQNPVLFLVDKVQNLPPDKTSAAARILRKLHQGTHGAPVTLVLAGLAHSADVLREAGLSRLTPPVGRALEPLSLDEARLSAEMFLERGGAVGDRPRWASAAARWSDGWPMHLNAALRATADELCRTGGDLDRIDPDRVRVPATRRRAEYYTERIGKEFRLHQGLLGRVMRDIGDIERSEAEIREMLLRYGGERPAGMTPDTAFAVMLSQGLLQRAAVEGDDLYICPIPSMRSFCAIEPGSLHRSVFSGDTERVRARLKGGEDPNGRDAVGRTPLQLAAAGNWPEIARMLLDAGADPAIVAEDGTYPADAARKGSAVERLLRAAAAAALPKPGGNPDFSM